MKKITAIKSLLLLVTAVLLWPGCATQNGNPAQARANTGYVDLHADSPDDLYWEVARFDDGKQDFNVVFSEFTPPERGILRLAFSPGPGRLRVTFLNRLIAAPTEVTVDVQDGKVIPVLITLQAAGSAQVETKDYSRGCTARGRYGARTKVGSDATVLYRLSAEAAPPVAYHLKERMSYAR